MARIGVRIEATEEGTVQRSSYDNLPNGIYVLQMEAAEVIEKNKGTIDHSIMVKSTFEVIEPEEFSGRKIFGNYNIMNKSDVAQRIGNEQFQCLLRSLEMTEFGDEDDTDILLFKSFTAKVGLGKDSKEKNADGTPQYPAKPEIKEYYFPDLGPTPPANVVKPAPVAANSNRRPEANQNRQAPAAAPVKAAGARPWGKR